MQEKEINMINTKCKVSLFSDVDIFVCRRGNKLKGEKEEKKLKIK